MHAAVVEAFGAPLMLRELDIPVPGPGQILVKTEACGVCHTDLHAARGDWPVKPAPPFTPGHEGIGLVAALGAGVTGVKVPPPSSSLIVPAPEPSAIVTAVGVVSVTVNVSLASGALSPMTCTVTVSGS